jgi:hypothetical protein
MVRREFPQLLVAGQARQLFLTYTLVCWFLKPNSQWQYLLAFFYNSRYIKVWQILPGYINWDRWCFQRLQLSFDPSWKFAEPNDWTLVLHDGGALGDGALYESVRQCHVDCHHHDFAVMSTISEQGNVGWKMTRPEAPQGSNLSRRGHMEVGLRLSVARWAPWCWAPMMYVPYEYWLMWKEGLLLALVCSSVIVLRIERPGEQWDMPKCARSSVGDRMSGGTHGVTGTKKLLCPDSSQL